MFKKEFKSLDNITTVLPSIAKIASYVGADEVEEADNLTRLALSARELIESYLGNYIIEQNIRYTLLRVRNYYNNICINTSDYYYDNLSRYNNLRELFLPHHYIKSITNIKFFNKFGDETIIDSSNYDLIGNKIYIDNHFVLSGDFAKLEINYLSGITPDLAGLPIDIKQALLITISEMYDGNYCGLPKLVGKMLAKHKNHDNFWRL